MNVLDQDGEGQKGCKQHPDEVNLHEVSSHVVHRLEGTDGGEYGGSQRKSVHEGKSDVMHPKEEH